ncbi:MULTISPECIES: tetratricopeptide repeat protein [unclassified Tolypothrix]|uniref:tetratricopeptide repeat protein n=1 Tax=unclassified Tolypothrix TaxID=2649714 RepID=UPI0005EAC3D4|nr:MULTISPECIES: tetratricopeptide repeat protein [unclassified Tolypothrix]BAY91970.1 TPR repeat-containing protein [Microchaete diplosiphon NIES-3275]EKF04847.1 tetratricopeptide repeat protein [Tolypothrix sp. PCC 7601]MBE9083795.1 tetratricopeptide repeat protein [Tolypothrix sp. LEGE 11397]UYD25965.1 tetratricopeptide repeat protein [Tolypothrix sp. PCC 7712]UYD31797.1 tetratricopeptide repeat protein [Tolypothrix sp. PCC 7601]
MKQRYFLPEASILNLNPRLKSGLRSWDCAILASRQGGKSQFLTACLLILAVAFSPLAASAVDITQQLHRPLNRSTLRDSRDQADSLLNIGEQQYKLGYADKTLDSCLQALEIYHSLGDYKAQGMTYDLLAKAYIQLDRLQEGEDALRRRLAIARDTKDFQSQIFALNNISTVLLQKGEFIPAGKTVQEALEIAQNVQNIAGEGLSLSNWGLVNARVGNYSKAIKLYETALSFRRQSGDVIGETNTLNNLGDAYFAMGNYDDTIGTYGAALRIAKTTGDRTNYVRAIDGLVTAHSSVGRNERAFDLLEQRLAMARDSQNLKEEFGVFMTYAKIYEKLNNYLTARNFYERALVLARTLEDSKQEVFLVDKLTKLPKH